MKVNFLLLYVTFFYSDKKTTGNYWKKKNIYTLRHTGILDDVKNADFNDEKF